MDAETVFLGSGVGRPDGQWRAPTGEWGAPTGNARAQWRGGNGSAGVKVRSRGRAAGGATGRRALRGYEGRTETPLQNSQRVLLARPRTAAASRGAMGTGVMAVGRDVPIAPPG